MIHEIIYFILPLTLSGLIHHFLIIPKNYLSSIVKPVDFNLMINNKRLFGDSKTWRGFFVFTLFTSVFTFLLNFYLPFFSSANSFFIGAIMGLSYSLGELPNSFIKRRLNIKPGNMAKGRKKIIFNLLDQADSVIFSVIVVAFIYSTKTSLLITLFLIGFFLHCAVDIMLHKYSYKKHLNEK